MSNWHKNETDSEAEYFSTDFWLLHREALKNGDFWAVRIKKLRGEPVKRLSLAVENLPLPGAFKEAAIAIRALIREKKKQKNTYEEELAFLYWLAAIDSFSIPYSEVLKEPGYNVIESIPGGKIKSLPFSYKCLGYKKLNLLNKTDIKWLIEQWGEPESHKTLHEVHNSIWCEYENKLKSRRERNLQELSNVNQSDSLQNNYLYKSAQKNQSLRDNFSLKLILIVLGIILAFSLAFVG